MARILIVGGSLGGLLAANTLLRAGHQVTVLEKATGSLDGRGAGIVTHAALSRGLARAGVAVGAVTSDISGDGLGVQVESRVALDHSGAAVAQLALPQVLTSWSRLYALLRAALPADCYRQGQVLRRVDQNAERVQAHCDSGDAFEADLLIASDGIRSALRGQYAPEIQPEYAGYIAWRGVCDEAVLSRRTLSTVFDQFGFGLPAGEQLIGYPVAGQGHATARGQRRYNFVWYRPADAHETLPALLTDADGELHPLGIPPHKVSWRQVAAMREAARALLAPQFAEIIEKTAQPFLQPIYDVLSQRLDFGRVALMGDAGFVARPHVGMGVTKAAEDAMALADSIASHGATPAAVQAYAVLRLAPGQAVVQRARALGAYLQAQGRPAGSAAATRDAAVVLRQTAVEADSWERFDPVPGSPATDPTTSPTTSPLAIPSRSAA